MPQAALAVITIAASAYGIAQQRKQAKAAKKISEQQNRLAELSNRNERIRAIRDARIKRAQMAAIAGSAGVMGSSGFQGGASSLASQLATNIGWQGTQLGVSQNIASLQDDIRQSQTRQATAGAVAGIARSMFGGVGGSQSLF